MSDDVIITVPTDGTEFIITNSRGEIEAHYKIKQNKKTNMRQIKEHGKNPQNQTNEEEIDSLPEK